MGDSIDRLVALSAGVDADDADFIVYLSGKLDWSPKKNWVDEEGGLPKPIEDMAVALIRDHGMDRSKAISIAVHNAKELAAKGEAKYVKAVAQWEKMKAHRHLKDAAK